MNNGFNIYKPHNAEKIEKIPAGTIVQGVIVDIREGTPKDFILDEIQRSKFKNIDEPAINVCVEFKYKDRILKTTQLFSFIVGDNKTLYADNSNMGKYAKQYGKLPEVSDFVQLISNAEGFFKIIM